MSSPGEILALVERLAQHLEDPHPGLITWRLRFSELAWQVGNYSGMPNYFTGPENKRFTEEEIEALRVAEQGVNIRRADLPKAPAWDRAREIHDRAAAVLRRMVEVKP